ncbi:hypothetical protein EVAR_16736_1 [Eumeta japonica]|uniref:Uncharacterized protein n=1 Tax=Eumeta variegata TaxID=151549 RepID=A0A4C1UL66_EUMVA|nr:hypothetical protein EVAR_16736_1 [Eumeta japonica]
MIRRHNDAPPLAMMSSDALQPTHAMAIGSRRPLYLRVIAAKKEAGQSNTQKDTADGPTRSGGDAPDRPPAEKVDGDLR